MAQDKPLTKREIVALQVLSALLTHRGDSEGNEYYIDRAIGLADDFIKAVDNGQ